MQRDLETMKTNLIFFRLSLGWSSDFLAKKIGCSKQVISGIENGNQKISLVQYVALRLIFDQQAEHSQNSNFYTLYKSIWEGKKKIDPTKLDLLKTFLAKTPILDGPEKVMSDAFISEYLIANPDSIESYCMTGCFRGNNWINKWINSVEPIPSENTVSMLKQLIDSNLITVFNATKHRLSYYNLELQRESVCQVPEDMEPLFEINVNSPLDVHYAKTAVYSSISQNDVVYRADVPSDFSRYDLIVVSKRYIDDLVNHDLLKTLPISFIDRLYIIDPVKKGEKVVGCKGFNKAFDPCLPGYYIDEIVNKQHPSIYSIQYLISSFELMKPSLIEKIRFQDLLSFHLPQYINERQLESCRIVD